MSPVIILTGASRGLGFSILQLLLKANARVVTLSRSTPDALVHLQEQHKDQLEVVQGDAASVDDNAKVVKTAVDRWGAIDGLVVNAGTIEPTRIADIPLDKTGQYVSTNLLSVLYLVQPALPYLRKAKGRVVLVSSGASAAGYTSWGLYSMVKAGMNSLARTLANEEKELSVWAIRPGMVDTSMQELLRSLKDGVMDADELVKFTSAYENGKLLKPEQPGSIIAGLVLDGPKSLSGEYLNWEDERLTSYKVNV